MSKPPIVSAEEWERERADLLLAEKDLTRKLDALAARRRRLPMVEFENKYSFDGPDGPVTLLDLFRGHNDLVVYQFMDNGPDQFCPGCTNFTNNVPQGTGLDVLDRDGVAWATISNMPLAQIEGYKKEKGWTLPFYSSRGTDFAKDCGAEYFMLNVFLRDGDKIYRTYSTTSRGVDRLLFEHNILDLTAYGRREEWEDSPEGWPQHPTYG